jgi:hypothetical protein
MSLCRCSSIKLIIDMPAPDGGQIEPITASHVDAVLSKLRSLARTVGQPVALYAIASKGL